MFPFELRLRKKLGQEALDITSETVILDFFEKEFIKRKADNVRNENFELKFNNKFFSPLSGNHIMSLIDSGKIKINNKKENTVEVEYVFSINSTLIAAGIIGIIFGLLTRQTFIGIIVFTWIGGMNLIITLIRQSIMLRKMVRKIKENYNSFKN